jgi:hypothetical protein
MGFMYVYEAAQLSPKVKKALRPIFAAKPVSPGDARWEKALKRIWQAVEYFRLTGVPVTEGAFFALARISRPTLYRYMELDPGLKDAYYSLPRIRLAGEATGAAVAMLPQGQQQALITMMTASITAGARLSEEALLKRAGVSAQEFQQLLQDNEMLRHLYNAFLLLPQVNLPLPETGSLKCGALVAVVSSSMFSHHLALIAMAAAVILAGFALVRFVPLERIYQAIRYLSCLYAEVPEQIASSSVPARRSAGTDCFSFRGWWGAIAASQEAAFRHAGVAGGEQLPLRRKRRSLPVRQAGGTQAWLVGSNCRFAGSGVPCLSGRQAARRRGWWGQNSPQRP